MTGTPFFVLALVSVLAGIACGMGMVGYVARRGERVNYFLIKLYLPKYVSRYMAMTKEETGRTGPLFLPFVVCMNLALVLTVIGVLLRS